jgi:hypothetical protein
VIHRDDPAAGPAAQTPSRSSRPRFLVLPATKPDAVYTCPGSGRLTAVAARDPRCRRRRAVGSRFFCPAPPPPEAGTIGPTRTWRTNHLSLFPGLRARPHVSDRVAISPIRHCALCFHPELPSDFPFVSAVYFARMFRANRLSFSQQTYCSTGS